MPEALGGEGASRPTSRHLLSVAQGCGSAGLIYAMHQVKVACIAPYTDGDATLEAILRRLAQTSCCSPPRPPKGWPAPTFARARRQSRCGRAKSARAPGHMHIVWRRCRRIVTTARRSDDAAPSDQVLAVFLKSSYTLEPSHSWDTLGMRGTCSEVHLRAMGVADNIVADALRAHPRPNDGAERPSVLGRGWAGIAAAAVSRAQAFIRSASRHARGQHPAGRGHLTTATASLHTCRVAPRAAREYERGDRRCRCAAILDFQTMITLTKVEASELARGDGDACAARMRVGRLPQRQRIQHARHLRDVLSSPIMIHNDRILASLVSPTVMTPVARIHHPLTPLSRARGARGLRIRRG